MKKVEDLNKRKVPIVRIDPSLERYRDKTLFPDKLAKANEMLRTAKLPNRAQGSAGEVKPLANHSLP